MLVHSVRDGRRGWLLALAAFGLGLVLSVFPLGPLSGSSAWAAEPSSEPSASSVATGSPSGPDGSSSSPSSDAAPSESGSPSSSTGVSPSASESPLPVQAHVWTDDEANGALAGLALVVSFTAFGATLLLRLR